MDAVMEYAQNGSAAVLAIQAGNDMVVTTDFQTQIPRSFTPFRAASSRRARSTRRSPGF